MKKHSCKAIKDSNGMDLYGFAVFQTDNIDHSKDTNRDGSSNFLKIEESTLKIGTEMAVSIF